MKKLVLGVALGWVALGFSAAHGQYFPPATTPYIRPPLFPSFPGLGGGMTQYGYGPFGTAPFGTSGPYGTMPFGTSPYNVVPQGVGPYGSVPGITGAPVAPGATPLGLNDPNVTGHPTRFFYYSRYFFNQGGATSVPLPGTRPILGANPQPAATPVFGVAPPRGKSSTGTGK
jgi:hypothetical protein